MLCAVSELYSYSNDTWQSETIPFIAQPLGLHFNYYVIFAWPLGLYYNLAHTLGTEL